MNQCHKLLASGRILALALTTSGLAACNILASPNNLDDSLVTPSVAGAYQIEELELGVKARSVHFAVPTPNGDFIAASYSYGTEHKTAAVRWNAQGQALALETLGGQAVWVNGLSSNGSIIVGSADDNEFMHHAVLWNTQGQVTKLPGIGGFHTSISAVSDDGSVIVGTAKDSSSWDRAVKWNAQGQVSQLQELSPYPSGAIDLTPDGSVIVGHSYDANYRPVPVKWDAQGQPTQLPSLEGESGSGAQFISDDGSVIVGSSSFIMSGKSHALKWDSQGQLTQLEGIGEDSSTYASDISADGSVIVGYIRDSEYRNHPAKWNSQGQLTELETLEGWEGIVGAVSADGKVIVGFAQNSEEQSRPIVWDETGQMTELPPLDGVTPSYTYAESVSKNGKVITGVINDTSGVAHPVRWTLQQSQQPQTITFSPLNNRTLNKSPFNLSALASSSLPVTFTSTTTATCTVSNSVVTLVASGTCTVTAHQAGNSNYLPAADVSQSFTIYPATTPQRYTINFEKAPANTLLYSVKLGSGIIYQGRAASAATVPIVGKRRLNGKILEGHLAKVINLYGSKRLTVTSANSNAPATQGGRIKLTFTNFNPLGATVTTLKLSNVRTDGAKVTIYRIDGTFSTVPVAKKAAGVTQVLTLNATAVRDIDIYVANDYAVDDVTFEVPPHSISDPCRNTVSRC